MNNYKCPCCQFSGKRKLFTSDLPDSLYELSARYPEYGITPSLIDALSVTDQYGTLQFIVRRIKKATT